MQIKSRILDADAIRRAVTRIAHEIVERHGGTEHLAIVGIRTRGAVLAEPLVKAIRQIDAAEVPLGLLDITLYGDDLTTIGPSPVVHQTEIPFEMSDRRIILVDDVLYTGRTVRAALDALIDYGRPALIQPPGPPGPGPPGPAAGGGGGHRELPIRPDYVGKNLPTAPEEIVVVRLAESDGTDEV